MAFKAAFLISEKRLKKGSKNAIFEA